jgi:hypothetical protein
MKTIRDRWNVTSLIGPVQEPIIPYIRAIAGSPIKGIQSGPQRELRTRLVSLREYLPQTGLTYKANVHRIQRTRLRRRDREVGSYGYGNTVEIVWSICTIC